MLFICHLQWLRLILQQQQCIKAICDTNINQIHFVLLLDYCWAKYCSSFSFKWNILAFILTFLARLLYSIYKPSASYPELFWIQYFTKKKHVTISAHFNLCRVFPPLTLLVIHVSHFKGEAAADFNFSSAGKSGDLQLPLAQHGHTHLMSCTAHRQCINQL